MRFFYSILAVAFCLPLSAMRAQQAGPKDFASGSDFVIDSSKPYVYLELDHVGPREPLRGGEPTAGLWLRLKNNCKLPIVVVTIRSSSQNSIKTPTLQDEVVPNRHIVGEDARGAGNFAPRGLETMLGDLSDIVRFPNMIEEEIRNAEKEIQRHSNVPAERPLGYNFYNGFDRFELTLIPPGGEAPFSVPINHVTENWHFEVPFRLAVPNKSKIRPPYSYLAFYQEDLDRAQGKAITPTTR
jgi:hypothetical protein